MKRILIQVLVLVLVFSIGVWAGVYVRNRTLNPRAEIPAVFSRLLGFLVSKGTAVEDDLLYHDVDITDFILNGSSKTKVAVEGSVGSVTREPDGDSHVVINSPDGLPLVTEFIPEVKLPEFPKVGDRIRIWGLTRFDEPHNWWELHPVIGWEKI